jgi:iron complex outermembrane receptor protein
MTVAFQRFYPTPSPEQKRTFRNELAPRLAILKKLHHLSLYSSIAKGFSPPATSELTPSGSAVNLGLNAEKGINYDMGIRGTVLKRLYIDVNAFWFSLHNTIVQRRDIGGGDYFINAGATNQRGVETYISYPLFAAFPAIKRGSVWLSHTWHHFHYKDFKQLDNDYSGNQLPAEPPHAISAGLDIAARNGLFGNVTYYYSDKIALNDANTAYANAYHLLGAKVGYEKTIRQKYTIQFFAGADNIFNQQYSLGNDINGFGGRYYNAAAGRNYYAGVKAVLISPEGGK